MAWIESHQSIERHYKTFDLMALMGWDLDMTIGKLHRFWYWCVDYAENGDLRRHNDARIGAAVGLNGGDASRFVTAMVEACWLDREPYFRVHDWWDYVGPFLISKYKRRPDVWQAVRAAYKDGIYPAREEENTCNSYMHSYSNSIPNQPNLTKPNQPESPLSSPHRKAIQPADETMMMDSLMVLRQWGATKEEAEDAIRRFPDKPPKYLKAVIQTARDNQLNGSPATVSTARKETATDRSIARLIAAGKVKPV